MISEIQIICSALSSKVDSEYQIYYPVTRRDEMQNRCSLLKMRCRNGAQDEMLSLEEMLLKIQLILHKRGLG